MAEIYTRSAALNRRLCLTVAYGGGGTAKTAAFTDISDAFAFARLQSSGNRYAEVRHCSGLIAQFEDGRAAPEFADLDAAPVATAA